MECLESDKSSISANDPVNISPWTVKLHGQLAVGNWGLVRHMWQDDLSLHPSYLLPWEQDMPASLSCTLGGNLSKGTR